MLPQIATKAIVGGGGKSDAPAAVVAVPAPSVVATGNGRTDRQSPTLANPVATPHATDVTMARVLPASVLTVAADSGFARVHESRRTPSPGTGAGVRHSKSCQPRQRDRRILREGISVT